MTGPAPAVAAARLAVRTDLADLPPGALVLVACSGGPDSLALAAATAFVAPRAGLRAGAVVVDHGLQPGSAAVADDAGAACRLLGLDPVRVVRVAVGAVGGPEGAARQARYDALEAAAVDLGAVAVLLGHTLDDQAETVLLGLARGSGARSLAGMPARRGLLRRPLLGLRRAETLAACAALGLEPWHDPTNAGQELGAAVGRGEALEDPALRPPALRPPAPRPPAPRPPALRPPAPRRSAVRRHVLPMLEDVLGPGVAVALARSAEQLREDADALDALAAELGTRARREAAAEADPATADPATASPATASPATASPAAADPAAIDALTRAASAGRTPAVVLAVGPLAAAPAALRRRALRVAAVEAGCPAGALHRSHVIALDALVTAWHGQGPVALPGRIGAVRACGSLTFLTPHD